MLLSQSLDGVSYTGMTVLVLGGLWLGLGRVPALAPEVVYVAACLLVMLFGLTRIRKLTGDWPTGAQTLSLKSGLRIMVIYLAAFFCDWIAVVTLGTWHGPAEAGIYRVAMQFGLLFTLVRNSFDQMVGSHIAARFADGDYRGMLAIARKTGMIGGALCLLAGVLLDGTNATLKLNQPWSNSAAGLVLNGEASVAEVGNAASVIGNLSGVSSAILRADICHSLFDKH